MSAARKVLGFLATQPENRRFSVYELSDCMKLTVDDVYSAITTLYKLRLVIPHHSDTRPTLYELQDLELL